jgi:meiotic recombination protein REC8, fungi type
MTRVYSQQCTYVLTDAQATYTSLKSTSSGKKSADLDIPSRKARYVTHFPWTVQQAQIFRREDLVLHDDPAFLPDINLPLIDIEQLLLQDVHKLNTSNTQDTVLSSRKGSSVFQSGDDIGLVLPSDNFGDSYMPDTYPGSSMMRYGPVESDLVLEADFALDEEGNIIEAPTSSAAPFQTPVGSHRSRLQGLGTDEDVHDQVHGEHQAAQLDLDNFLVSHSLSDFA